MWTLTNTWTIPGYRMFDGTWVERRQVQSRESFDTHCEAAAAARELCRSGEYGHIIRRPDGSIHECDQVRFG